MSNSIGAWSPDDQPNNPDAFVIDTDFITLLCSYETTQFSNIAGLLNSQQIQQHAALMQLNNAPWQKLSENLDNQQVRKLIEFFTLAEQQLADWHGGDKSPVIWLVKVLKQRGEFPDKDLLRWIRANSNNRFLPYGSAL